MALDKPCTKQVNELMTLPEPSLPQRAHQMCVSWCNGPANEVKGSFRTRNKTGICSCGERETEKMLC